MEKGADVLIIALGRNDGLRGISPEETKKNLLGIVAKARTKNPDIEVFIAGMQMPDNIERYRFRFSSIGPFAFNFLPTLFSSLTRP